MRDTPSALSSIYDYKLKNASVFQEKLARSDRWPSVVGSALEPWSRYTSPFSVVGSALEPWSRYTSPFSVVGSALEPWSRYTSPFSVVGSALEPWSRYTSPFSVVGSALEPWSRYTSPFSVVGSALEPWSRYTSPFSVVGSALEPWSRYTSPFSVVGSALEPWSRYTSPFSVASSLHQSLAEVAQFEESGWFPHGTFPRHLLDSNDDVILSYYRSNWTMVKQVIGEELSDCHVGRDAKNSVRQALIAHENGLYRLIPPSLFAAVEQAVRDCLYSNRVGQISMKSELIEVIGHLPISVLPGGNLGFAAFTQLKHHSYESIHTETAREHFLNASVPNRHATIHGLVIYSSEKSSLNAIFLTMYVFQVLSVLVTRGLRNI